MDQGSAGHTHNNTILWHSSSKKFWLTTESPQIMPYHSLDRHTMTFHHDCMGGANPPQHNQRRWQPLLQPDFACHSTLTDLEGGMSKVALSGGMPIPTHTSKALPTPNLKHQKLCTHGLRKWKYQQLASKVPKTTWGIPPDYFIYTPKIWHVRSELDYGCKFVQKWKRLLAAMVDSKRWVNCACLSAVRGDLWPSTPLSGQVRLSLVHWIGFGGAKLEKNFQVNLNSTRCVEVVLGCRVLHWIVGSALNLLCVWSVLTNWVLPGFLAQFLGLTEDENRFIGMVYMIVEFIVNWQPRCINGKGCVHVSNLPYTAYPAPVFSTSSVH